MYNHNKYYMITPDDLGKRRELQILVIDYLRYFGVGTYEIGYKGLLNNLEVSSYKSLSYSTLDNAVHRNTLKGNLHYMEFIRHIIKYKINRKS